MLESISFKVAGEAGAGVMTTGQSLATLVSSLGFNVFGYSEYPSLIRGGHNTYQVTFSKLPVRSPKHTTEVLVALNPNGIKLHLNELTSKSTVIYDSHAFNTDEQNLPAKVRKIDLPAHKIALNNNADPLMANNASLGAAVAVLGIPFVELENVLTRSFAAKGTQVIVQNVKVAKDGFDYVNTKYPDILPLIKTPRKDQLLISGNEAIALGALAAGCKFFAGYPMTPTSALMHFLAKNGPKHDMVVKHTEDEISAVNMAIGASFTGVRAMTATSGGGFALMSEGVSLAGITETPIVIVEGQRPGPATGMPTWTAQEDLDFVLSAGHGEFPRIVLSPGDISECFWSTVEAFNLADIYQTPVIILTDKMVLESHATVDLFDLSKITIDRGRLITQRDKPKNYSRYQITTNGISPRAIPGMRGFVFAANSDEHEESGQSTESDKTRIQMTQKRFRKLALLSTKTPPFRPINPQKGKLKIISFGSNKGVILDALDMVANKNDYSFLSIDRLNPINTKSLVNYLKNGSNVIVVENNFTGQLEGYLKKVTGVTISHRVRRYDGRPFMAYDLAKIFEKTIQKI